MNDNLSKFIKKISQGAIKYSDPRKLNSKFIDKKIRKTIININKSDKICTLWSCQGHSDKKGKTLPYITFVVSNDRISNFLKLIYITLPLYKNKVFPVTPSYYFTINRGFSDKHFTIISIHWCDSYLNKNNSDFYSDLFFISKRLRKLR